MSMHAHFINICTVYTNDELDRDLKSVDSDFVDYMGEYYH